MLQRVASNAHSWWWASHIRTKQSKWLEQSLADMEEKVHATLQIIDHDGDSFAKRVDMYYRKRPDIINFIEESFKAYRALAERYDHLSRELQSANRTVAQVFPERVQFALDEEDENSTSEHLEPPISKVPSKAPSKDFKTMPMMRRSGQGPLKRNKTCAGIEVNCLGLTETEALKEIDELHKRILGLQTEKEFVKSVYEHAANKYMEIENQITEMQAKVCSLQDDFGIGTVIEDSEARSLMATTALRSCQETLKKLHEKHELTIEEAKDDYARIKESHYQLEALKVKFLTKYCDERNESAEKSEATKNLYVRETTSPDLKVMIKQSVVASSSTNLSVIELAEKIDDIVNKVVKLETLVASQNTLVKRLTSETDELQGHIREVEGAKEYWIQSSEIMRKRIKELEEEMCRVKNLNQNVEDQSTNLQTHFVEVSCNIAHLSEQLHNVKLDEDLENAGVLLKEMKETLDVIAAKETKNTEERKLAAGENLKLETTMEERKEDDVLRSCDLERTITESNQQKDPNKDCSDTGQEREKTQQKDPCKDWSDKDSEKDVEREEDSEEEDIPNWRQMYLNTLDDREKNLLEEYTSVLRNYKDVKRKLNHVERGNRESLYDLTTQVRELVKSNTMRDAEIQALRQELNSHQTNREHSSFGSSPGYSFSSPERPSECRSKVNGFTCSSIPSVDVGRNEEYLVKAKEKDIKVSHIGECNSVSTIEEKIRTEIDQLLEENLEFWLRFSNSIQQKHKLQATIQDLKAELSRVQGKMKQEGSNKSKVQNSDVKPIYRHLREIHTELKLWLEQNAVLKDDVQSRFSCFCHIQDEISGASSGGRSVEDVEITENQAAKFQGEVLNMIQENKKIEEELETSLERMKILQVEVEKVLEKLDKELGMSSPKGGSPMKQTPSRPRIPLRSFLFGVKLKKQKYKNTIFSYVSPSMQKPGGVGSPRPL